MNKLPKDKRDKIIGILVGTVVVLGGIWMFIIRAQQAGLIASADQIEKLRDKISSDERKIKHAKTMERDGVITTLQQNLSDMEKKLAPGSSSAARREWIINGVDGFSRQYHSPYQRYISEFPAEVKPMPKFPYNLMEMTVSFVGYYHDFGKFLSAFENTNPFIAVADVHIAPGEAAASTSEEKKELVGLTDRDKLTFTVAFQAVVER